MLAICYAVYVGITSTSPVYFGCARGDIDDLASMTRRCDAINKDPLKMCFMVREHGTYTFKQVNLEGA